MEKNESTELLILAAAQKVFLSKGLNGARMQDIADETGMNKALLHYYYRNKETLFELVLVKTAKRLFGSGGVILGENLEFFAKIEKFIGNYLAVILDEPQLPTFVLYEFHSNPEKYAKILLGPDIRPDALPFMAQVQTEIQAGRIRPIEPAQLVINIVSLCMFPFVAKPVIQTILNIPEDRYQSMLHQRKDEIFSFIKASLRP